MLPIDKAILVAQRCHANQTYGIFPYIYHVMSVVELSQQLGYDEVIQVACALHDTMEDSDLTYNDIKQNFGVEVADIVFAVTDADGKNRKERKEKTYPKIAAIKKAIIVKVLDRCANILRSIEEGSRFVSVYKSEDAEFREKLGYETETDPDVKKAWDNLDRVIYNALKVNTQNGRKN